MPFGGLLTVGIISAGAQIYGAHKASSAANKAADQQVASAAQAKADLAPIHQQNVARMEPYAALGGGALGKLSALGGIAPVNSMAGAVGRDASGNPLGPINGNQGPMNMGDPRVQHLANGGSLVDMDTSAGGGMSLSALGGGGKSAYGSQPASFPLGGSMVRLKAPDGEIREFPAHVAQQLEAQFGQQGLQRV